MAETASIWPPPQRKRLQTSCPMWSVPKSRFAGRVLGWPTNAVGECGAKYRPNTAIATSAPTSMSPMRVRQSPSALRISWPVGRRAAATSGMATMPVSAIALTDVSSGAA